MSGMLVSRGDCVNCYGTGVGDTYADNPREQICHYCYGTGANFTALGQELIEFLREYFELTPKVRP